MIGMLCVFVPLCIIAVAWSAYDYWKWYNEDEQGIHAKEDR